MLKTLKFISIFVPILLILTGIALGTVALQSLSNSTENLQCFCPSCPETEFSNKGAASLGLINADIQGAVKKPGVYELEIGQNLADLLSLAGGFIKEADQAYVARTLNLAKELKNEDKIYIPFFEENQSNEESSSEAKNSITKNNSNSLVSINNASSEELQTLSGVGEVRAKAIIEQRPYSKIEDLISKEVLSNALFDTLKDKISL